MSKTEQCNNANKKGKENLHVYTSYFQQYMKKQIDVDPQ